VKLAAKSHVDCIQEPDLKDAIDDALGAIQAITNEDFAIERLEPCSPSPSPWSERFGTS
jgi:hypothetical protein